MKKLVLIAVALFAVTKYTERGRRARKVYAEEVASGARPIQAVGTSIAALFASAPTEGQEELEKQTDKALQQARKSERLDRQEGRERKA